MMHRAIFGTLERFVGFLIEHFAGAFPLWLSPEQVRVLPIADAQLEAARGVHETLLKAGVRSISTSAPRRSTTRFGTRRRTKCRTWR
jgi:threonyl-tRNA synthetase